MNFPFLRRSAVFSALLFAGDVFCVAASIAAAFWVRFYWEPFLQIVPLSEGKTVPTAASYVPLAITAAAVMAAFFIGSGFYRRRRLSALDELVRVGIASAKGWTVVVAATFLYREVSFSRGTVALAAVLGTASVFLFREAAKLTYDRLAVRFWPALPVLVMGSGRMASSIQRVLGRYRDMRVTLGDFKTAEELDAHLSLQPVREIYAGEPDLDHKALIAMTEVCDRYRVPFKIVPDVLELRMGEIVFDDSLGLPTYRVRPVSLHGSTFFYKRLFDVTLSVVLVSLAFFPLLFIAFLIRLDSRGSVLFSQLRLGHQRQPFPFFKFRSMVADADRYLEKLKALNDRPGSAFKMKNDPRITRMGRWIRKFSVDEVPQILNVLRGEMSLVGPRPQVLWEAAAYDEWARKRLNVLPGITGLWQVSGRASLSFEQMIELDTYYIEHWSPGLDLLILFRTLPAILGGDGAY